MIIKFGPARSRVAIANATSWFTGSEAGNNHAATLSGIKTQQLANSQDGQGGYNQLVFDDTANQSRISLQQHEAQHTGDSELNLGQLTHQSDNQRLNSTGFGLELKTRHSAAVRAGNGLLISSDHAPEHSMQMDSHDAQAILARQHQANLALAQSAAAHQAVGATDPTPDKLAAITQLHHSQQVISQQTPAGSSNDITTYSEPHLQLSSPAGIIAATATNAVVTAGNTSNLTAEQDISVSSQAQQHHAVKDGIRLFTQGTATDSNKPNQETGIKLHAAQGKLSSQSQSGSTHINASKDVYIASTEQAVTIAAPQHLLLTSGGAYIKLEGGNIEVHGPGMMAFKGSLTELAEAGSGSPVLPELPKTQDYQHAKQIVVMSMEGTALDSIAIALVTQMDKTGLYQATTDSTGVTPLHEVDNATQYAGIAGRVEWSSIFADNESATADDVDLEDDPGESSENGREEEQLVGGTAI